MDKKDINTLQLLQEELKIKAFKANDKKDKRVDNWNKKMIEMKDRISVEQALGIIETYLFAKGEELNVYTTTEEIDLPLDILEDLEIIRDKLTKIWSCEDRNFGVQGIWRIDKE